MKFQSACLQLNSPKLTSRKQCLLTPQFASGLRRQLPGIASKLSGVKKICKDSLLPSWNRGAVLCASKSDDSIDLNVSRRERGLQAHGVAEVEPFRGKPGSVSFYGATHHKVEERKLVSSPFVAEKGSLLWVLGPVAFISSLILPQFFLGNAVEALFKDRTILDIVISLIFEVLFYVGLGIFFIITERVQQPYLQFSSKRWSLITGLRGYLPSSFFTVGFKVIAPLFAVYVTWPMIGLPAVVSVFPFLLSCAAQLAFEKLLDKGGFSCWPIVPIVFEIYRLYQLIRATNYIERLIFSMNGLPKTPELLQKSGAMVAMLVTFQALGLVCLWSLLTFLMRLFPSRPVADNY